MATRRKFTLEFKTEAVHRVIDSGRSVVDVAKEIAVPDNSLFRWVRDERRRMEALEGTSDQPLSPAERAELLRLRRQVDEQEKVVHGGVPSTSEGAPGSREHELSRFRGDDDCLVLIANPAAMAEGVSLHHACHDAIYVDRTFNAGQYLQSMDRIHRLGLPPGTETRMTFLVSEGTIDEMVDSRVRVKAERLSMMLSDLNLVTMALPDEEAYGTWIDEEDLGILFGHLANG
jgi:transposase-like protein